MDILMTDDKKREWTIYSEGSDKWYVVQGNMPLAIHSFKVVEISALRKVEAALEVSEDQTASAIRDLNKARERIAELERNAFNAWQNAEESLKEGVKIMGELDAANKRIAVLEHRLSDNYAANLSKTLDERDRYKLEAEILRQYGNKDCTAMADEALEEALKGGK